MMSSDAFFSVTKTFGHEQGFSCAFRQWRATSHCHFLHGYALSFEIELFAKTLDARNWVYDFGGFSQLKEQLKFYFDHTTAVAEDDPELSMFTDLHNAGIVDLRVMSNGVGCERFAEFVAKVAQEVLTLPEMVCLKRVTVKEHAGNSATYFAGKENDDS